MLPAKYQPNRPGGSGEEEVVSMVLPYIGMAASLNFGSKTILAGFYSHNPWRLYII